MAVCFVRRLTSTERLTCSFLQTRHLRKEPKGFGWFGLKSSGNNPPFDHIVQVGDPVLRIPAQDVQLVRLKSSAIQFLLRALKKNLDTYDNVGISAPQIGVPLRVFAIRVTEKQISGWKTETASQRNIKPIPLKYFINPDIKIIKPELIVDREGCGSVYGFSAEVARAKEVEVRAFDENGEPFVMNAKDWTARIVQHEMDHLKGR